LALPQIVASLSASICKYENAILIYFVIVSDVRFACRVVVDQCVYVKRQQLCVSLLLDNLMASSVCITGIYAVCLNCSFYATSSLAVYEACYCC